VRLLCHANGFEGRRATAHHIAVIIVQRGGQYNGTERQKRRTLSGVGMVVVAGGGIVIVVVVATRRVRVASLGEGAAGVQANAEGCACNKKAASIY